MTSASNITKIAIQVFFAAVIMYLGGQVHFQIPLSSVPITLQSFAVLVLPWAFTGRNASGGILLWLTLGVLGLPVFADHAHGIEVLLSNSGGYLVGMYLITYAIRWAKVNLPSPNFIQLFVTFLIIHLLLSAIGLLWIWIGEFSHVRLATHFYPYLPGIVFKSLAAAVVILVFQLSERRESSWHTI